MYLYLKFFKTSLKLTKINIYTLQITKYQGIISLGYRKIAKYTKKYEYFYNIPLEGHFLLNEDTALEDVAPDCTLSRLCGPSCFVEGG